MEGDVWVHVYLSVIDRRLLVIACRTVQQEETLTDPVMAAPELPNTVVTKSEVVSFLHLGLG
jgi:hypothetical protein